MKRTIILTTVCICLAVGAYTQRGSGRPSLGAGLLHENELDVTPAYEHEMNYRHVREFSANGCLQWAKCEPCKHVCPKLFWRDYRTYSLGVVYRSCVARRRSRYGSPRIGVSSGSNMKKFLVGLHFGYEYNHMLRAGWTLYWQIKGNITIKGADVLRTEVVPGIKLPIKQGKGEIEHYQKGVPGNAGSSHNRSVGCL